jgi:hypothetical protein
MERLISNLISTPEGKRKVAEAFKRNIVCQACGAIVLDLSEHCQRMEDDLHVVVEVMEI